MSTEIGKRRKRCPKLSLFESDVSRAVEDPEIAKESEHPLRSVLLQPRGEEDPEADDFAVNELLVGLMLCIVCKVVL